MQIEELGINGAIISSIISQMVSAIIVLVGLKRSIDIKFKPSKFLIKPIIATASMIICAWLLYGHLVDKTASVAISFLISMLIGIIIYMLLIIILKIFEKDEFFMLPYGEKIYKTFKTLKMH